MTAMQAANESPRSGPGGAQASGGDPRRWRILGVLALVQFMLVLDVTVVNVALPHIQVDLGFSRSGLAWVVDGYTLTAGGLLLLGGRLADLVGRRRMFLLGVILFTVASATSGAAADPGMLVASRFVQGAGEAMASPAAFGLVALLFPDPAERTKAIGMFSGVAGLGGTLGPIISGMFVEWLDWRWIFFVNIPVALVAVVAVRRSVAESRAEQVAGARPDWQGALLGTAGLTGAVYGLIEAATWPWGSVHVLVPLVLGAVMLGGFVVRERVAADPLIPEGFFANRTRVTANVVTLFFTTVFFTLFFLLTLYMQEVLGWTALRAGLAYLPFGLAIGAGIGIATSVLNRSGARALLTVGMGMIGVGMYLLAGLPVHGHYLGDILPAMVVLGVASGLCFVGLSNAAIAGVSHQDASLASGVQTAVQQVGGAVGLAVLVTVAIRNAGTLARHGSAPLVAAVHGYTLAYRVSAVIVLVGAVVAAAAFGDRALPEAAGAPVPAEA